MSLHSKRATRRDFLKDIAIGAGGLVILPGVTTACAARSAEQVSGTQGWDLVPSILARIVPPKFPDRDFDISRYGAVADGRTDATSAFRSAIEACSKAGGGRVVVPSGRFLTGPIRLASNVNLHVADDAVIAFTTDPSKYLPAVLTRFEGVEVMNYSPLVYALDSHNVAITGKGTLDGQAANSNWWPWKGNAPFGWKQGDPNQLAARKRLFDMAEQGVPVNQRLFGAGDYLRPSFIQPYRCRNVLIEDVKILRSPMWEVHPVLSSNVTVRGVRIDTHGPNNDGCNPESCRDVLIERCYFDTGDDCIAIKSGRNADGRRLATPSENIIVRECEMRDGHGGVTIGSEISGGVRNVFTERCRMDSPNLDRALRFKNNAARGGVLEHIYMRDVTVGQVADAVLSIDFHYEEGAKGSFDPVVRDVEMRNVTSKKSEYAFYLRGLERGEISNVRVIDCSFENVAKGSVVEKVAELRVRNTRVNGQLLPST
ncbi:MAG TPA: glycoside hydrolase family 28 protein [Gemmatimonadaceae bacterium]|nr:glycoside hydrolase family 28 protein [Gemmatimonadaceae bacterium]